MLSFPCAIEYPEYWVEHNEDDGDFKLVLLDSHGQDAGEWISVASVFHSTCTIGQYTIQRIERIQNKLLWKRYLDCARRMDKYNNGVIREVTLFHGTKTNDPEEIYKGDAGFDMRFSNEGLWGKGNYFAVNASYSDGYAHHCVGRRQMLVAKVLTGYEYSCQPKKFSQPPFRPDRGNIKRSYDSVSGIARNSKVYITYENERAYPAYLITYLN